MTSLILFLLGNLAVILLGSYIGKHLKKIDDEL